MKHSLLLLSLAIISSGSVALAQQFRLISSNATEVALGFSIKQLPYKSITINGGSFVDFKQSYPVLTMEQGAPALPLFATTVQLPAKGLSQVVVEFDDIIEIQNVSIAPSKGSLKRNVNPAEVPYEFGAVYSKNEFYPANTVTLNRPFVWRSLRGQSVTLSPYQYNPVTKTLRFHTNMRVRVVTNESVAGINESTVSELDPAFLKMQQRQLINASIEKYEPLEETGEMLILCPATFQDALQPFVNWKTQKGLKTYTLTVDPGTTDVQLKQMIQNYYASHEQLMYVLLVGDNTTVPSHTYGPSASYEKWSDSYFAQLAGDDQDYYPEVFVGRFSAETTAQLAIMINRSIDYEKNPAPGTWMENAIGLASDEGDGIGDDDEADWEHMRNIRSQLMEFGYQNVYEFYDGTHNVLDLAGSPTPTMISAALMTGVGLFNYTGHGDKNRCISGNFKSSDIDKCENTAYPLVISVACNNGTFVDGTCISEVWLRSEKAGSPNGAIAAAGSTILMAWAEPMQAQDEMTEIIAETYVDNRKSTIGGIFFNGMISMLENYPTGNGVEVMQTWVLFGDPSTEFRNKQTMVLSATHVPQVAKGTSDVQVNCDVEGALVAISQNNVLLGTATVNGGVADVLFDPITSEYPLLVVATKQNYNVYQGVIEIGDAGIAEHSIALKLFPNPASTKLTIVASEEIKDVTILSLTGQEVNAAQPAINGTGNVAFDITGLASGSYLMKVTTGTTSVSRRFEVVR